MNKRESLKTLPGVTVIVESFSREAADAGFDRHTFQTDVELKLRMAGISVLETEDLNPPELYVNVNVLRKGTNQLGAFSVRLALSQEAVLQSQVHSDRGNSEDGLATATMFATTWSIGALGFGDVAYVRSAVRDLVDEFVNDWLAVNPLNGTA